MNELKTDNQPDNSRFVAIRAAAELLSTRPVATATAIVGAAFIMAGCSGKDSFDYTLGGVKPFRTPIPPVSAMAEPEDEEVAEGEIVDDEGNIIRIGSTSYINFPRGSKARSAQEVVDRIKDRGGLEFASFKKAGGNPDSARVVMEKPVLARDLLATAADFKTAGESLRKMALSPTMTYRKADGTVGTFRASFVNGPTNEARGQFSKDEEEFWIVMSTPDNPLNLGAKYGLLQPLRDALYDGERTREAIAKAVRAVCGNDTTEVAPPAPTATRVRPTEVPPTATPVEEKKEEEKQTQTQTQTQNQQQNQNITINVPPVPTAPIAPTSAPTPTETPVPGATATNTPLPFPTPTEAPAESTGTPTRLPTATSMVGTPTPRPTPSNTPLSNFPTPTPAEAQTANTPTRLPSATTMAGSPTPRPTVAATVAPPTAVTGGGFAPPTAVTSSR